MMDDIQLRDECLKYLDAIRGKAFINKATGIPIVVNRMLRGEIIGKSHARSYQRNPHIRARLLALKNIQGFLTDSDPVELFCLPKQTQNGIESSSVFKYKCRINGCHYCVEIRTRKPYNHRDRLYFMSLQDITIEQQ